MTVFNGKVIRYTQDCELTYGNQLRAFEIDTLTPTDYQEHEVDGNPIFKASGNGWNSDRMHHVDPHQLSADRWIACVDGFGRRRSPRNLLADILSATKRKDGDFDHSHSQEI